MKTPATYEDLLTRHVEFKSKVFPQKRELFSQLATGQNPHVTFLTCSDSRIDPCIITQTEPGDLFVIRNAGNMAPVKQGATSGEVASLEFAVQALKTRHIVVCGHSDCGAMKGLLAPEKCAHLPHVSAWVRESQAALASLEMDQMEPAEQLERLIVANVLLQLENLRQLDFVREAEAEGKLSLHGWVYHIGSGDLQIVGQDNEARPAQVAA